MAGVLLSGGRRFAVRTRLGSVPEPKLDSKGRLDPTWDHSGSILEAFLIKFLSILDKILMTFSRKAMHLFPYFGCTYLAPLISGAGFAVSRASVCFR